MPNDLEDFLRQAAAMRQQKTQQQRAEAARLKEQQARSRPPAYSNARAERVVDAVRYTAEDDEPVMGIEVLDTAHSLSSSATSSSASAARTASAKAMDADNRNQQPPTSTATAIREMLRRPDGLRQAFLIREILNRPRF